MSKFIVEPSPHIRGNNTTDKIMTRVLIALVPALVMSVYIFGIRALYLSIVCVGSCVIFEMLYRRLIKKETEIDPSPAVTGLLLAFCLPVTLPYYMAVIGCFIAIVVVKQLFGGLGQNFANPAITARIVLTLSFTAQMTYWAEPFHYRTGQEALDTVSSATSHGADALSGATPLALAEAGEQVPGLWDLFMGFHGGSFGETSGLALIIGFIFLVLTKVIRSVTPLAFVGTVALGALLAPGESVILHVFSGGLLIGAIFMATDYATTPVSIAGKFVFGVGCGLITLVIRFFSDMPEGVSFAILIMNILTFYIDKITFPKPFGMVRESFVFFKKNKEGKKE
ncbi:MAG: RnfABCDGE type electron transport complex subunit D [Oscillospiraceae bacterium]|jgi:electron transport complex protein RnfD|nr:RnfABCDGE type electron transport complex subunit D [Oscillospiraceae bacterium]